MEHEDETEMLKRVARQMFGPDVILTPPVLENIREIYHLRMADRALNDTWGGEAA